MESNSIERLRISEISADREIVVAAAGRLDIDSSPELRDRLLEALQSETLRSITLDLNNVAYMDASGIATLLEALKIARSLRVSFRLKLHERQHHLLEVTGLLPFFESEPDTNAALRPF